MFYTFLTAVCMVAGLGVALLAVRVLLRGGWFWGWLRGMLGLACLVFSVAFALAGLDMLSYKAIVAEKSLAVIKFTQVGPQRFSASLVLNDDASEHVFPVLGDQWQLDARVIKWPNALASLGVKPGYRLERVSGRYFSLEQELNAERSVYQLPQRTFGVDVWRAAQSLSLENWGIDATYGSATYLPMADGAEFEVSLSRTGLLARPFNNSAENAVGRWE